MERDFTNICSHFQPLECSMLLNGHIQHKECLHHSLNKTRKWKIFFLLPDLLATRHLRDRPLNPEPTTEPLQITAQSKDCILSLSSFRHLHSIFL